MAYQAPYTKNNENILNPFDFKVNKDLTIFFDYEKKIVNNNDLLLSLLQKNIKNNAYYVRLLSHGALRKKIQNKTGVLANIFLKSVLIFASQNKKFNVFPKSPTLNLEEEEEEEYSLLGNLKIYSYWQRFFGKTLKTKFIQNMDQNKSDETSVKDNAQLLHYKFKRNLNKFLEYKKQQEAEQQEEEKNKSINILPAAHLLYRLKHLYLFSKKLILQNTQSLVPLYNLKKIKIKFKDLNIRQLLNKVKKNNNKNVLKIYLPFLSKRVLKAFLYNLRKKDINFVNSVLYTLIHKNKNFLLKKIKQSILISPVNHLKFDIQNLTFVKSKFSRYFSNNILFEKLNLMQHLNVTDFLKNTDDISKAAHFRFLNNKENDYYQHFVLDQDPICLLTKITGHNIYLTLYISKPYKILWKASSGMLSLKHFRRAKKHQNVFKDLLLRCQLFLARYKTEYQRPFKLILRSLNYFGNKNLLRVFLKKTKFDSQAELNEDYKLFKFFQKVPTLINNHALKFLNTFWIREKKIRLPKLNSQFIEQIENKKFLHDQFFPELIMNPNLDFQIAPELNSILNINPYETKKSYYKNKKVK